MLKMVRLIIIILIGLITSIEFSCGQVINIKIARNWSLLEDTNGKIVQGFDESFQGFSQFIGIDFLNFKYLNLSGNVGLINKKGEQSYYSRRPNGGSDLVTNKTDFGFLAFNATIDLKYPLIDTFIPYLSVGPRLDYLLSDKSVSRWKMSKSYVLGMTIGSGIKFNVSKVQIGLRYDRYLNFQSNSKLISIPSHTGFISEVLINEKIALISLTLGYKMK